jgi:hypothetical protein
LCCCSCATPKLPMKASSAEFENFPHGVLVSTMESSEA